MSNDLFYTEGKDLRDKLPIMPCPRCGGKETIRKNVISESYAAAEYDLHCKTCNLYLGNFSYGSWSY